jgi:hypothetical protein
MEAYVRERREAGGDLVSTSFEYRNFPGWHFFTLHERLATKDHAIAFLRSGWGLEDAELVVFGDDVKARGSRSARPLDHNARAVISSPHVHRRPPERAYGSTRPLGLRDGDP